MLISAQAFCVDLPKWRTLFNDSGFDANIKENRQIVAHGLKEHLTQLNAYIPNLKPSELEWLDQENKALDKLNGEAWTQRFIQLEWAPERQTKTLKGYLNAVIFSLSEIVSNDKLTLKEEMSYWAHVVLILIEDNIFNESLNVLKKHGRINFTDDIKKKMMLTDDKDLWLLYRVYGRNIQREMVWPYLKDEINK